jgi:hypothetical protein
MTRIMSATLLLFIVAIAAPVVVFADSAMQWSLRLILDEGLDYPRAKAEVAETVAAEKTHASQTGKAKAA